MLSERNSQRAGWMFGDVLLMVVFLLGVGWAVWELFLPHTSPRNSTTPLTLRPSPRTQTPVNMDLVYARIRNTVPVPARPEWVAAHLSPRWRGIVVHHSATLSGNAEAFARFHKEERHMENGLAYHFVICNGEGGDDGLVQVGRRWTQQLDGGHVKGDTLNHTLIGICLVGDFRYNAPTEKQLASLKGLLNYLLNLTSLGEQSVQGHTDVKDQSTICPGPGLPVEFLLKHRLPAKG